MDRIGRLGGKARVGVAMSSRFVDLLKSIIYDLKRSVDLRRLLDLVLHSSLDDLVFLSFFYC